jgi:hypothetical protein
MERLNSTIEKFNAVVELEAKKEEEQEAELDKDLQ